MKIFWIILAMTFFSIAMSCGSDKPEKLPSSNQRKLNVENENVAIDVDDHDGDDDFINDLPFNIDSVSVILSQGESGDKQVVFIDNTNNPEYYNCISNFTMPSKFEISMFRSSYSQLSNKSNDTANVNLKEIMAISDKWIPLVVYNDDYYYYCPAKVEYNKHVMITDSCMAVFDKRGVSAELIQKVSKPHENYYSLDVLALDEIGKIVSKELNIYIIDSENKIAIWEEFFPGGINYRLMIAKSEKPIYPVIVNYGQASTPEEYKFEEINYFEEISNIID